MKRAVRTGLVTLLLGIAGAAQAQKGDGDWIDVFRHDVGMISADRSSIRREGDAVSLRTRTRFNEVRADGTSSFVALYRYDCRARTAALQSFQTFGSDGNVIQSQSIPTEARRVEPVGPTSPNERIIEAVCR